MRETLKDVMQSSCFAVFVLSFIVVVWGFLLLLLLFLGGGFLFLISEFAINLSAFNCILFVFYFCQEVN